MPRMVDIAGLQLDMYEEALPDEIDELRLLAQELQGVRVLHINSTLLGGGVSEILRSVIPIERALGIDAHWQVITGDERFFHVTKSLHNALQGAPYNLTKTDQETYLAYNKLNAESLESDFDYIFVHDPQPVALRALRPDIHAHWIWRCHIDTSTPNPSIWGFLLPFIQEYDAAVFTMQEFVPKGLGCKVAVIAPAIDPLSPKNMELPQDLCWRMLKWIGVPKDGPVICQVSRFDPWKDPLGVIDAYRLVSQERPDARLILVGSMATDDPEGWEMYDKIIDAKRADPRIHVFTNFEAMTDVQVNALQRLSDVVVQKSIKEGFGLVVSETLWKGTPVVAGRAGGIPLQLAGGGGFLAGSVDETAMRVLELLANPKMAEEQGRKGRHYVREHFLITRLIRDDLKLMLSVLKPANSSMDNIKDIY